MLIFLLSQPNLRAHRISDSLQLSIFILPTENDSSYELDVLEHLSSAGLRSNAKAQKVIPCVPLVGIVPMNEEWTVVLVERWEVLDVSRFERAELQGLFEDIVGVGLFSFFRSSRLDCLLAFNNRPSPSSTRNTSLTSLSPLTPSSAPLFLPSSTPPSGTTTPSPPSTNRIKGIVSQLRRARRSLSRRRELSRPLRDGGRRSLVREGGSSLRWWICGGWGG